MEHATPAVIVWILLFLGPVFWSIWKAKRGKEIFIRRIPGIDAIEDAVGRAVEMGRPVSFTSGIADIGPTLYASLSILRHIAKKVAGFGAKLFVPSSDPQAMVLTESTLRGAYREARKSSLFDASNLRFISTDQFAFASGYMGLIERENVSAAFLFGSYAAESLILAEAGQRVGAIQIAGTPSTEQVPFFITTCDYTLIGEELFAAGAFLSNDPVQRGSLRGQDIAKFIVLLVVILGVLFKTASAVSEFEDPKWLEQALELKWEDLF